MRKIQNILAAVALLMGVSTAVQAQSVEANYPYNFISLQGGAQTTFTNQKFTDLITPQVALSAGRYFNSKVGARLHLQGWQIKSAITDTYKFNAITGDIDLLMNMSNIINITLLDNKGQKRSLTDLKGQVVMLDFHLFATRESTERIMLLRDIYNRYHARGLEIYQVSVDPDEHFWKTQTAALPWVSVWDADGANSKNLVNYNVQSVPTYFLIDRSNSLYKRDVQIKDLDAEIQKLL
jgi:peroxiredoxin